ncbi:hypothetical protein [Phaffia rhodozyma]|uniref:Uncharacterized protein n=1 Tax=Phaffia rhodozyma TaxID=264483 RepID=A0A0F7SQK9_PHARH|nr:hypothetical protein [Phaffia rhodozyma]
MFLFSLDLPSFSFFWGPGMFFFSFPSTDLVFRLPCILWVDLNFFLLSFFLSLLTIYKTILIVHSSVPHLVWTDHCTSSKQK